MPALVAHARRLPLPVEVRGTDQRFPAEVETAVYFCCIEALQNVVKHSGAGRGNVTLACRGSVLRFEVRDDGIGFAADLTGPGSGLQNMTDRLAALEGTLEVRSDRNGTSVAGMLPVERLLAAGPTGPGQRSGASTALVHGRADAGR